ncbi:MAG: hypothetical protein ACLQGP_30940 [Isosphaeraceae bacterium]
MVSKKTTGETRVATKPKRQSAFVSAPLSIDTNLILQILKERGLETIRLDDTATGQSIYELLRKSINRADYVIAVMGEGKINEDVLFELGMATGLRKHVLVLAPHEGLMPPSIAGLTYLRTDPGNREAIEFGLDQLLSTPDTKPDSEIPEGRETHPIGEKADRLKSRLKLLREGDEIREADLIEVIYEAIQESGISTLAKQSRMGKRRIADLAVWSNDLEPWIGNPLIIEVKKHLTSRKDLERTIQGVSTLLDETRSPGCLLIYLEAKPAILYGSSYDPRIMVLSAEEFIEGLRDAGLGDLLRSTRNENVTMRGQDASILSPYD